MRPWWMLLGVQWDSYNDINGKRFYNCKFGCLVIHPDKTIQYFRDTWFSDFEV